MMWGPRAAKTAEITGHTMEQQPVNTFPLYMPRLSLMGTYLRFCIKSFGPIDKTFFKNGTWNLAARLRKISTIKFFLRYSAS